MEASVLAGGDYGGEEAFWQPGGPAAWGAGVPIGVFDKKIDFIDEFLSS